MRFIANATFADGDEVYKTGDRLTVNDTQKASAWQEIGYIVPAGAEKAPVGTKAKKPKAANAK